jgi:hypothetical protein
MGSDFTVSERFEVVVRGDQVENLGLNLVIGEIDNMDSLWILVPLHSPLFAYSKIQMALQQQSKHQSKKAPALSVMTKLAVRKRLRRAINLNHPQSAPAMFQFLSTFKFPVVSSSDNELLELSTKIKQLYVH